MTPEAVARVLADPLTQRLLETRPVARLAYQGSDGYPRVIPIGYLWTGERFVVCTASNAPKVRHLKVNPKAALTIDTEDQPPHILLVRGEAEIGIVEGVPDEYLEASRRYVPGDQWDGFVAQTSKIYQQMARITITAHWAKLIDFERTLPVAVEERVEQLR